MAQQESSLASCWVAFSVDMYELTAGQRGLNTFLYNLSEITASMLK